MINNNQIQVIFGDITHQTVDAIINVNKERVGCKTGGAVITVGDNLPAKFIIYTVVPVWHGGKQQEAELLFHAYLSSLRLASENEIRTIAFPNIGTGIFGFPKEQASKIAVSTIVDFLNNNKTSIVNVVFVCSDQENYELYKELVFNTMKVSAIM